jgi:hypothetical protein
MSKTLNDLLTNLRDAEDGVIALSPEQLTIALGSVKDKVDSTFEVISRLESEVLRLSEIAKEFTAKKKTVENQVKRLKEYVQYSMESDETTELLGDKHRLRIMTRKGLKVSEREISSTLFLEFPEVINRVYSFDKNLLKEKFKANPEKYAELVSPSLSTSLKFTVKG